MPTVHIVHGFNVSDGGKDTIDTLIPELKAVGFKVVEHDYGRWFFLRVRLLNKSLAKKIAAQVKDGDIAIGHSNGCAVLYYASKLCKLSGLVFIQPALDNDKLPDADWIHIYYNEQDDAVSASRILRWHIWGNMGQVGYTGVAPHVQQFDTLHVDELPEIGGHSTIFSFLQARKFIVSKILDSWITWFNKRNGI